MKEFLFIRKTVPQLMWKPCTPFWTRCRLLLCDLFGTVWIIKIPKELFDVKDGIDSNTWHDEQAKRIPLPMHIMKF